MKWRERELESVDVSGRKAPPVAGEGRGCDVRPVGSQSLLLLVILLHVRLCGRRPPTHCLSLKHETGEEESQTLSFLVGEERDVRVCACVCV